MITEMSADVAVLMPKIVDSEKFRIRCSGLEAELSRLAVSSCFVESHTSYDPVNNLFVNSFGTDLQRTGMPVRPAVVRDLTMTLDQKPLYDQSSMRLVHDPVTSRFLADKSNLLAALAEKHPDIHPESVVVHLDEEGVVKAFDLIKGSKLVLKPAIGSTSKGVQVVTHPNQVVLDPGVKYIGQEFIDTSGGMPRYNIQGVHNLRVISIGSKAIGGIARVNGDGGDVLQNGVYGTFIRPEELTESTRLIVGSVQEVLRKQPGDGQNVVAIDVMNGSGADGEVRETLSGVYRKPLRISRWDYSGRHDNLNAFAVREMAVRWDKAEAAMLAGLVEQAAVAKSRGMKKILVIGSKRVDASKLEPLEMIAVFVQDTLGVSSGEITVSYSHVDELVHILDGQSRSIQVAKTAEPLESFDFVWFRGKLAPALNELAIVCQYLDAKQVTYANHSYADRAPFGKLAQMHSLATLGLPYPKTVSTHANYLPEVVEQEFTYPIILKAIHAGHGHSNYLVRDESHLRELLAAEPDTMFVAQTFIANDGDFRVLLIGDKELIILRKGSEDSHLNNTSQGGAASLVDVSEFPADILMDARKFAAACNYQIAGVDVMFGLDDGKPYFLEANSQPQLMSGAFTDEKAVLLKEFFLGKIS